MNPTTDPRQYVRTDQTSMPTVTTPAADHYGVTVYRFDQTYGLRTQRRIVVDRIDRDDLAAFIRGAIADAYHAGRNDARAVVGLAPEMNQS